MSISPLIIRPLLTTEEYDFYYRLADTAFSSQPSEEGVQRWQHFIRESPDFLPEQVRGAFRAAQQMGGYTLYERVLRIGSAHISTGCIGAVVTAPGYRKQGVASALMQDVIDFARERQHALLLLDGIPNFYFRYGYQDLFDVTAVEVNTSAILAQTASTHSVRFATEADAPAFFALYNRHFAAYTGSFVYSLEVYTYRLFHRKRSLIVALSPQGKIEGYLCYGTDDEMAQGRELAADNWDALLALLQYHAHLFDGTTAARTLLYSLPLDAPETQWMIDTLEVPDTSQWDSPAQEWGVRSLTYHHRFTGWMGRLINFPLLMNSLLPELQARWRLSLAQWTGEILLVVAGQNCLLRLNGADLQLAETPALVASRVELTPQALIQLVFGYRKLSRLTNLAHLSAEACSALAILFPYGHTWIPGTDWF